MSVVGLRSVQDGAKIFGTLRDDLSREFLLETRARWGVVKGTFVASRTADDPEYDDWDWSKKFAERSRAHRFFAVEYEGRTQGLMQINTEWQGRHLEGQTRAPAVYVDHLESAPWNLERYVGISGRLIGGVGPNLLVAAGQLSWELGFDGRLELHSLAESLSFYREFRRGDQRVFTDLGLGWLPYPELHYFASV